MAREPTPSQFWLPLTTTPMNAVASSRPSETRKAGTTKRRIQRSDIRLARKATGRPITTHISWRRTRA